MKICFYLQKFKTIASITIYKKLYLNTITWVFRATHTMQNKIMASSWKNYVQGYEHIKVHKFYSMCVRSFEGQLHSFVWSGCWGPLNKFFTKKWGQMAGVQFNFLAPPNYFKLKHFLGMSSIKKKSSRVVLREKQCLIGLHQKSSKRV